MNRVKEHKKTEKKQKKKPRIDAVFATTEQGFEPWLPKEMAR